MNDREVKIKVIGRAENGDQVVKYYTNIFAQIRQQAEKLTVDLNKKSNSGIYAGISPQYNPQSVKQTNADTALVRQQQALLKLSQEEEKLQLLRFRNEQATNVKVEAERKRNSQALLLILRNEEKEQSQLAKTSAVPKTVSNDRAMQAALADIKRIQSETVRGEQSITRQIEKEAEAQFQAKTKQLQRGLQEVERVLNQEKQAQEKFNATQNSRSGAIDSFLGNFSSNVAFQAIGYLKQGAEAWLDYASKIITKVCRLKPADKEKAFA